mmetsp:Transcript_10196/g.22090  ORF Transcript_10196/g.22090 Transcript_10196/m.22090 type:complete len:93 (+) Transcript_10196:272-550(+)
MPFRRFQACNLRAPVLVSSSINGGGQLVGGDWGDSGYGGFIDDGSSRIVFRLLVGGTVNEVAESDGVCPGEEARKKGNGCDLHGIYCWCLLD